MSDSVGADKFKISVILPVYNVEKYLHRCMDSIVSQTMDKKDFEVIMVDDGAKDSSPKICDDYSLKYDNFKVIHQLNGGAAAARNAGLLAACGEYAVFVDPDDYIEPDYLETAYFWAKENDADIAVFDAVREGNPTQISAGSVGNPTKISAGSVGNQNLHGSTDNQNSQNSTNREDNQNSQNSTNREDNQKQVKQEKWGHAPTSFVTRDKNDILSMRCQILYPYMAATVSVSEETKSYFNAGNNKSYTENASATEVMKGTSRVKSVEFVRDIPLSAPWDKCYKRAFLVENNLQFPSQLKVLDDMSFNFAAFGAAGKIAYTPKALYHYCIEPTSITNSYKENRPELDMQVFEYLKGMIEDEVNGTSGRSFDVGNDASDAATSDVRNDNEGKNVENVGLEVGQNLYRLYQAYYARIIKSFAICCRLCFFNEKNPKLRADRLIKVKSYMEKSPYKEAFENIRLKEIDYKLTAVTIAGRLKSPRMLKMLDRLQNR